MKIGDSAETIKKISNEDIVKFSEITGDLNPLHLDTEYAKKSIFKKKIAHGILVSGLISAVIANKLPGVGSIYLSQTLKFIKPVFVNDEIKARVEIIEFINKNSFRLKTQCFNQKNELVLDGEAIVLYKKY